MLDPCWGTCRRHPVRSYNAAGQLARRRRRRNYCYDRRLRHRLTISTSRPAKSVGLDTLAAVVGFVAYLFTCA